MLSGKRNALDLVGTIMCVCGYKTYSAVSHSYCLSSSPELFLGHEDRKKLHEFEEKCVQVYFHEKSEGLHSSQINRIRATAERLD